jgi:hypothetical protein
MRALLIARRGDVEFARQDDVAKLQARVVPAAQHGAQAPGVGHHIDVARVVLARSVSDSLLASRWRPS